MKFCVEITEWGEEALGFLEEEETKFIVIFNENAPEELREISVLHTISQVYEEPEKGDTMIICGKVFDITAVGEEAKYTLRTLGHCTIHFTGGSEPALPGCIMVEGEDPLTKEDIVAGGVIEIY
ncbi:MAG: PTS glucitol/sorbitol transporter subunit IIA [Eubacteriales bacterium]|nr:PTS glucitol/sorbitol transporter subunit IIA [Eubacteriales bacterium]